MLVDVHCHLDFKDFNLDLDEVIKRAEKNGFVKIINSGVNQERNENSLKLAEKYKIVEASLGVYPTDSLKLSEEELDKCLDFIKKNKNKIIAVGECGLDFSESQEREKQIKIFQKVIDLTEELKLPILIHSRKAEKEAVEILESSKLKKVIMHCFSGNRKLVKKVEENGWSFSVPTNIVFSEHFQNLVKSASMDRILTETDSPFLSPIRGKRNEPYNIIYSIKKISELKQLEEEEVKKIIYMNYQRIFSK